MTDPSIDDTISDDPTTRSDLLKALAPIADQLVGLAEALRDLDERVARVEAAAAEDPSGGFLEWLNRTLARYYLADYGPSILTNTAMMAEWQALYKAHKGAYRAKAGDFEQVYWHDSLARVIGRMNDHTRNKDAIIYNALQPANDWADPDPASDPAVPSSGVP